MFYAQVSKKLGIQPRKRFEAVYKTVADIVINAVKIDNLNSLKAILVKPNVFVAIALNLAQVIQLSKLNIDIREYLY